jgi:hypothetical protein
VASCTSTHESAEKLKRSRARPAPGSVASTAGGGAAVCELAAVALGGALGAALDAAGAGGVSRTVARDAAAAEIPSAAEALSGDEFPGDARAGVEFTAARLDADASDGAALVGDELVGDELAGAAASCACRASPR